MRKGDLKKQEILHTAEQLFCKKGYEETSVQDILDILRTSKGSFYHHFVSKESLLENMCDERADAAAEQTASVIREDNTPIQALNLVLSGMMPLDERLLSFLMMLLPVFGLPEGKSVQNAYRASLSRAFTDLLKKQLQRGNKDGTFCCTETDITAEICLGLANDVWCRISELIIESERNRTAADPSGLLAILTPYRAALERILSAPYGSIRLMDLADLRLLAENIHVHWK